MCISGSRDSHMMPIDIRGPGFGNRELPTTSLFPGAGWPLRGHRLCPYHPGCGSVGLEQFPVGQILLHGAAAHGGLDIVPARRNGVSAPCAARPSPGIEKFRIRFDDPVRVHRLGTRGIRAIRNPLRRPKDREIRQAVAIRRETADDNRSGFGAGTQAEHDPEHRA